MKFIVYTTENNLIRLCSEKENSWFKIIMKMKEVVVSTNNGDMYNQQDPFLQTLHRAGVTIYTGDNDFINQISSTNPANVLDDPCAAYLLDITDESANNIQSKYGVICQAHNNNDNILTRKGWTIRTSTVQEKSWKYFFTDHNCPINSLLIIDRYFFSSEPNESIEDSFFNLEQILDTLLPPDSPDNVVQVIVIFDFSTFKHNHDKKIDGSNYTFQVLAERINKIKRKVRRYAYTLELLSITSNCYKYEDTHDRHIVGNYFITEAVHKLKTFTASNDHLCAQTIYFKRLFEEGIDDEDKSTPPVDIQEDILKCIIECIEHKANYAYMDYACNGCVAKDENFEIKNRLLLKEG